MATRGSPEKYETRERAQQYAGKYRRSWLKRLSNRRELGLVRRALQSVPDVRSVLDCPCGAGRLALMLAEGGARVFGVDTSAAMIREAGPGRFAQAAAQALPFADDSFDAVVCHRLLHHFPDREDRRGILAEAARVARTAVIVSFSDAGTRKARRGSRRKPIAIEQLAQEAAHAGLELQPPVRRIGGWVSMQAVARLRVV